MSDTFNNICLNGCNPIQILSVGMAVNDPSDVKVFDKCHNEYSVDSLKYSYSTDGLCWSCWMDNADVITNTLNEISDYFIRIKVPGEITSVEVLGNETEDYTTSLDSSFNLSDGCSSNNYNPYANIDGALQLQESLSNQIVCTIGIPIYYFKASGKKDSADMTFKEYALKSIESVKQIKLVVGDGQMPSSKPEFSDFGLDWQTDWQTEISKSQFATAFGNTAQPMEGDLIYIPLMKRMWMVNEAYDERNGSLMWQSTTWQVFLTKYQADTSMDLNVHEDFIDDIVKTKYEDLFGKEPELNSGVDATDLTRPRPANMYPVFKSDATRKEMTCKTIDFVHSSIYHHGTLVSDNSYKFIGESMIIYQHQYCGDDGSISFIIHPFGADVFDADIIKVGNVKVNMKQSKEITVISCPLIEGKQLTLQNGHWYFITVRWSKQLRLFDMSASLYTYPEDIPMYKLTNYHYYFDIDNVQQIVGKWTNEFNVSTKHDIEVYGFPGTMTNIKVMDEYHQDISELLQQYPTSSHLLVNDTARPLTGLLGTN